MIAPLLLSMVPSPGVARTHVQDVSPDLPAGTNIVLAQGRDSTNAAQEVAGLERLGELLVWGDRSRFRAGQRARVLRHQGALSGSDGGDRTTLLQGDRRRGVT